MKVKLSTILGVAGLGLVAACGPKEPPGPPTLPSLPPGATVTYGADTYAVGLGDIDSGYGDENLDKVFGSSGQGASDDADASGGMSSAESLDAATVAAGAQLGPEGATPVRGRTLTVLRTTGSALTYSDGFTAKEVARLACTQAGGTLNEAAQGRFAGNGVWSFAGACS